MNFNDLHTLFRFIRTLTDDDCPLLDSPSLSTNKNSPARILPDDYIKLNVMGTDNATNQLGLKKSTPLQKLKSLYSTIVGVPKNVLRFRYDGQALNDYDTPTSMQMLDGDTIETYLTQIGGGPENQIPSSSNITPLLFAQRSNMQVRN